jgi:2-dehydro-3-deoxyphosphogluconate aldolase/(4S)-4-hydroxy-2-oxoglutarate aldolase
MRPMSKDEALRDLLARHAVLPIMTIRSVETGLRLAESLLAGGLTIMEITLRTAEGPAAISAIRRRFPEMAIGAGTLLRPEDLDRAATAGAQFGVSPGLDTALADAAQKSALPFLPGVQTASEVMTAVGYGLNTLKFYPARAAGGPAVLADFGSIFRDVMFVPTGKISQTEVPAYLDLANVLSVGGSWMTPADRVAEGDWPAITALAAKAAAMARTTAARVGKR